MVRLKTRWLLVRIVTSDDGKRSTSGSSGPSPNYDVTKKELAKSIKESLEQCFGVAASAAALDLQVRFFDDATRLALIRVPRQDCATVRAAVTLTTSIGVTSSSSTAKQQHQRLERVVLNVLSVNGSARTAKLATIRQIRRYYFPKLNSPPVSTTETMATTSNTTKAMDRIRRSMDETLDRLICIDY